MEQSVNSFRDIAQKNYIEPANAVFAEQNGFLTLCVDGKNYPRTILRRAFPFDMPDAYITVFDGDSREIGMIRSISEFPREEQEILRRELARAYYMPEILKILSMKEHFGFSYWHVKTATGDVEFTLQDTYRSILHVSPTHLIFLDVNSNRFEIPDVERLDRKSYRKLELYL